MYLCCVWKFGCLFTSSLQFSGMHSLDLEWIIMLPVVELGIFSNVWMFPRALSNQNTTEIHLAWYVN